MPALVSAVLVLMCLGGAEDPAQAEKGTAQVERVVEGPKVTKKVKPAFPERAAKAGLNGAVVVLVEINADGSARPIRVVKGYKMLTEAALDAVRKWRYTPGLIDGVPSPVLLSVIVDFRLERPPSRGDLIEALRDPDSDIRWSAATWLGHYKPATGEQWHALRLAVRDADEGVAKAARDSLAGLAVKD